MKAMLIKTPVLSPGESFAPFSLETPICVSFSLVREDILVSRKLNIPISRKRYSSSSYYSSITYFTVATPPMTRSKMVKMVKKNGQK